jgi:hypothetical protein
MVDVALDFSLGEVVVIDVLAFSVILQKLY